MDQEINSEQNELITVGQKKLEINWEEIAVVAAEGVVSSASGEAFLLVVKEVWGKEEVNYRTLFKEAINEICGAVRIIVNDALFDQYLSDANAVKDQLLQYTTSSDSELLYNINTQIVTLVNRIMDFIEEGKIDQTEGVGAFIYTANLHLYTLRCFAEIDPSHREFYVGRCHHYSEWLKSQNDIIYKRIKDTFKICKYLGLVQDDDPNTDPLEKSHCYALEDAWYNNRFRFFLNRTDSEQARNDCLEVYDEIVEERWDIYIGIFHKLQPVWAKWDSVSV